MNQKIIYTCPMHPEVRQETPGNCPECGMALVPVSEKQKPQVKLDMPCCGSDHAAHVKKTEDKETSSMDKHAGHSKNIFRRKFWVSFALMVPILLYADIVRGILPWNLPDFPGRPFLIFILGSIIFFYGGLIFLTSAYREIRGRMPGMMTLIAIAISAAYLFSVVQTFVGGETLFWELATLITIMLLGHWLEMRAVQGAQGALKELSKLLPDTAEVIRDGKNISVPLNELRLDDVVVVRPGGRVAVDGVVVDGESAVDESIVTGESRPVDKKIGSQVIAGSTNGNGALRVKVAKIGEETFLSGIMRLVQQAQASKSRLQLLADRAAFYLTIVAVIGGGITLGAWLLAGASIPFAVTRLVAVLVIACPHALGLAIPLVATISTTKAAHYGFLVKQRLALEMARKVDIVLFDKTGTLTKGEYGVQNVWLVNGKDENEVIATAASVDIHSEHFISKAIVAEAKKRGLQIIESKNFKRLPGFGVSGMVGQDEIFVGGQAIIDRISVKAPADVVALSKTEGRKGKTIIFVAKNKNLVGVLALADLIRPESREAVEQLKQMGIRTAMITGDSADVANWVAQELGLDEHFSRVLPEEKASKVKILQDKGFKVVMVGDGINDAPALTQADVGIAIGAGTNVAIESAGIILIKNDPRDIVRVIKLSRATYTKMIQNLFWATGYNVIAMPLAAGALAFQGIILQPALAALLMSFSTVIVAVNAMFLKNKKI